MSISKIFIKCNNKYNKEFAQDVVENLCCAMGNTGSFMVVLIFQTANSKSALNKIRFRLLPLHQRFELRLEAIQKRAARLPLVFCSAPCPALRSDTATTSLSAQIWFPPISARYYTVIASRPSLPDIEI